ncbi:MAG: type II toxin-antitoxin system VapC family toxin [Gammaproteobacteria bacterium]|nr:type II toxin-antitoxin system VapC family toxin [Gammaproteobacteria bacterium]
MILVDTSVWIDHLRHHDDTLAALLNNSQVLMHPYISGELACGNLTNRVELLHLLAALPQITTALDTEVHFFIEQRLLMGKGIGYIDTHLLAAVALDGTANIWTRDKRLHQVAESLSLSWNTQI